MLIDSGTPAPVVATQIGDRIETVFSHYTHSPREAQLPLRNMSFEATLWAAGDDVWGSDGETSVRGVCALDESVEQMSPFGGPETNQKARPLMDQAVRTGSRRRPRGSSRPRRSAARPCGLR